MKWKFEDIKSIFSPHIKYHRGLFVNQKIIFIITESFYSGLFEVYSATPPQHILGTYKTSKAAEQAAREAAGVSDPRLTKSI